MGYCSVCKCSTGGKWDVHSVNRKGCNHCGSDVHVGEDYSRCVNPKCGATNYAVYPEGLDFDTNFAGSVTTFADGRRVENLKYVGPLD